MDTCPQFFRCHPNLDDEVNRNIVESEIEGGAFLEDLPARAMLQIQTQHRWYTVVHRGRGEAWIWGHPAFCPEPVLVRIEGSSWGGSMLKIGFVGRGMHLEFRHPAYRTPIVTSRILEIRQTLSQVFSKTLPKAWALMAEDKISLAKEEQYWREHHIKIIRYSKSSDSDGHFAVDRFLEAFWPLVWLG